jgi:hypothetical protein
MKRDTIPPFARWSLLAVALAGATAASAAAPDVRQSVRNDTSRPLREIMAALPTPVPASTESPREIPNIFPKDQQRSLTMPEVEVLRALRVQDAPSGTPAPPITFSFDGLSLANGGGGIPPDTNGDVSPTTYIQWINTSWATIDKVTGARSAPVAGSSFWAGFGGPCEANNDGDPIALWDDRAQRWVMSQFVANDPGQQCFAISTTSDPLGSYHRYQFDFADFGDYPHIGVWTDGGGQSAYLLTTHEFNLSPQQFLGAAAIAVERDKMLAGQPAAIVRFGGIDAFGISSAHLEGQVVAPAGACPLFVHFDFDTSEYLFWDLCLNWAAPATSTFSTNPTRIAPAQPFVPRFTDVEQLGSTSPLDSFGTHIMYRATARAFPEGAPARLTMVVNHTVLGPTEQGAIKWAQFNFNPGAPAFPAGTIFADGFEPGGAPPAVLAKSLFDEGTFTPDANSRWMGGIAIDRSGNIGLGYSVSSPTISPQLRTTGRTLGDAAGTMRDEQTCTPATTGSQLSTSGRWGDYASMSIDPVDECTFWFTSEYYPTTATSSWFTRVCKFKFDECGVPTFALVNDTPRRVEICGTPTPAAPTFGLRLGVYDGFSTPTTLAVTGLPGGANPSFSPATVTPPGTSVLTLAGAPTLASGEYAGTVTATAGPLVRTLPIQLGVSSTLAGTPTLSAPADGATGTKLRPTLSWAAVPGAIRYRVEVSTSNTFATLVASDTVTTTSWVVNATLTASTQYFWRVRADNYCGTGTFSAVRNFTTGVPGTCPSGTTLTSVFTDDFQGGVNGWTTDGTGGTAWSQQIPPAGTGLTTTSWRVPNNAVTSDRGLISPAIAIPAGAATAFVSFDAHYSFETDTAPGCWDGAAIEAKQASATTFTYLGPAAIFTNGYNGVILAGAPLAGREVWCRPPSPAPARSIVDLDSFIGQSVQLRFRATSDSNTVGPAPNGMSIDNLRVDVCQ